MQSLQHGQEALYGGHELGGSFLQTLDLHPGLPILMALTLWACCITLCKLSCADVPSEGRHSSAATYLQGVVFS